VLALARPRSLQAQGGFPTKLGEYLATGNPVVVTKVGDIPLYLTDNETAFLAEPNDVDSFAKKIEFVLSNPDIAMKVGEAGKRLTQEVFNYKYQANNIVEFISSF
jgi:glycosyltransferase involved in cell wall biosynthesis